MVLRAQPIIRDTGEIDDEAMLTYYGCAPTDWEEASSEKRFVELIDGRILVHSPAGLTHHRLFGFLHVLLHEYVESRKLGEVLTGPFTMELALERKFEPDIIFVSNKTRANLTDDRLLGPADLAIEIASPSTRAYDRTEKRECYRVGGVREYWMIDPIDRKVTLDRPAGVQLAELAAGRVESATCPGYRIQAEWLWTDPLPSVQTCLAAMLAQS